MDNIKEVFKINKFENLSFNEKKEKLKELEVYLPKNILKVLFSYDEIKLNKNVSIDDLETAYRYFNKNKYLSSEALSFLKKIIQEVAAINMTLEPLNTIFNIDYDIIIHEKILKQYIIEKYTEEIISCTIVINDINGFNSNFIDNDNIDFIYEEILENKEKILKKLDLKLERVINSLNKEKTTFEKVKLLLSFIIQSLLISKINTYETKTLIRGFNRLTIENGTLPAKLNGFILCFPLEITIDLDLSYEDKNEIKLIFNSKDNLLNEFLNNFQINTLLEIHNSIEINIDFIKNIKN